ncbi:DUF2934 family protein [Paraburkholderia sp. BL9I2N2]|nr:DUF2934 family protein [Paraburkholderia sp. BL9I2N2]
MHEMTVVERIRARAYELWQQDGGLENQQISATGRVA